MKTGMLAAALAAATMALAGCKDSTGSVPITAGSLAFGYSGARSGTFSTSGAVREQSGGGFEKQQFATGVQFDDPGQSSIGLIAYLPLTATTGHEVIFAFPTTTAGQDLVLMEDCTSATCAIGLVLFDINPEVEDDGEDVFFLTAGTLHVSTISGGRITGTFSGTAEDLDGARTITITGGAFDVPLVDSSRFPSLNRSAPTPAFQRLRRAMAPR